MGRTKGAINTAGGATWTEVKILSYMYDLLAGSGGRARLELAEMVFYFVSFIFSLSSEPGDAWTTCLFPGLGLGSCQSGGNVPSWIRLATAWPGKLTKLSQYVKGTTVVVKYVPT